LPPPPPIPTLSQATIKRFIADSAVRANDLVSMVNSTQGGVTTTGRGGVATGFGLQVSTALGSGSLPNATDLGTRALFNLSSTVAVLAYLDVNSMGAFAVLDPANCVPKVCVGCVGGRMVHSSHSTPSSRPPPPSGPHLSCASPRYRVTRCG
jgi:hypothetical protein